MTAVGAYVRGVGQDGETPLGVFLLDDREEEHTQQG